MEVKTTEIIKVESKIFISFYQDFLHYLEKRGLLSRFVNNVEKIRRSLSTIATCLPYEYVASAFTWDSSREGMYFWSAEDTAWRKHIDSQVEKVKTELLSKYGSGTDITIVVE